MVATIRGVQTDSVSMVIIEWQRTGTGADSTAGQLRNLARPT